MKRIAYSIAFLLVSLAACKKDDPKPTPTPVVVDPCANITCQNGGHCVNGSCACPQGYSGPDCSTQLTPTKIRITKIEITKFPATTPSGGGWDINDGPDLSIDLLKGSTPIASSDPEYVSNAQQGVVYTYVPDSPWEMTDVTAVHGLALYDNDQPLGWDFMGGITFTPYSSSGGFPATGELSCTGCNTAFKIYVNYVW